MASSMFARFILSNTPSVDSVMGVAVYHNKNLKTIRTTARCLDLVGRVGLRNAVLNDIPGEVWLSDDQVSAKTDEEFKNILSQFTKSYSMDIIVSTEELRL